MCDVMRTERSFLCSFRTNLLTGTACFLWYSAADLSLATCGIRRFAVGQHRDCLVWRRDSLSGDGIGARDARRTARVLEVGRRYRQNARESAVSTQTSSPSSSLACAPAKHLQHESTLLSGRREMPTAPEWLAALAPFCAEPFNLPS
jgi:hypothetical protein